MAARQRSDVITKESRISLAITGGLLLTAISGTAYMVGWANRMEYGVEGLRKDVQDLRRGQAELASAITEIGSENWTVEDAERFSGRLQETLEKYHEDIKVPMPLRKRR